MNNNLYSRIAGFSQVPGYLVTFASTPKIKIQGNKIKVIRVQEAVGPDGSAHRYPGMISV